MVRRRLGGAGVVAVLLGLCLPAPAAPQIGGFIKKKVKDAAQGRPPAAAGAQAGQVGNPAGPVFDEWVLELVPANLDKLQRGLQAEKQFRDSVEAVYAHSSTPQQYQACMEKLSVDPEMQQLLTNSTANTEQEVRAYTEKMQALVLRKCGTDPSALNKAADLAGAPKVGERAAGVAEGPYGVMKERVKPFCRAGGAQRVPGDGSGIYYVYSPAEVEALQPRCSALIALLAAD